MSHTLAGHVRRNALGYLALIATLSALGLKPGDAHGSDGTAPDATTTSTTAQPAEGAGNIGARARGTSSVVAKHGGWTDIPLTGDPWTQSPDELELVAGTADVGIPASCTGSLGNALVLSVDGKATTFASAPAAPASGTVTVPFLIGTLSEPGQNSPQHKLSARFGNSCTKGGEDYTVDNVKVDVLKFH